MTAADVAMPVKGGTHLFKSCILSTKSSFVCTACLQWEFSSAESCHPTAKQATQLPICFLWIMVVDGKSTLFLCSDTCCANLLIHMIYHYCGGATHFTWEPKLGLVLADVILFTCLKLLGSLTVCLPPLQLTWPISEKTMSLNCSHQLSCTDSQSLL